MAAACPPAKRRCTSGCQYDQLADLSLATKPDKISTIFSLTLCVCVCVDVAIELSLSLSLSFALAIRDAIYWLHLCVVARHSLDANVRCE